MKTHIQYRDIPKAERKSLAAEAYRRSGYLRTVRFASIFIPILLGGAFANEFGPADQFLAQVAMSVAAALMLCLAIWESLGRPKLKAEVERLKNA
jgi:hypothetical protein